MKPSRLGDAKAGGSLLKADGVLGYTALVLYGLSLFLPVFNGNELGGILPGWCIPLLGLTSLCFGSPMGLLILILPLCIPMSFLLARKSYSLAALAAGLGILAPAYQVATAGLEITQSQDASVPSSSSTIFASGLLCWLLAALLMTIHWTLAALQSHKNHGFTKAN